MTDELRGGLDGEGLKIAIVVARFNDFVTSRLLDGAKAALSTHGVRDKDLTVVSVPGSFEIPVAARRLADSSRFDSVVCLGAVIRGETDHWEYVAGEAAKGIARASQETGVPVIFGVLTTNTVEQAIERAGGEDGSHSTEARSSSKPELSGESDAGHGNAGYGAGLAAIEMANLVRAIDSE